MRALILAAGRGTRLGRLSRLTPKPLTEIDGETLVARLVRQCAAAGVDRVHVVVGHEHERVMSALEGAVPGASVTFVENPDYATTNNIVSLRIGLHDVLSSGHRGDLLLIECDVVVDDHVLPRVVAATADDVAVVSPFRPGMDGTVVHLDGDRVRELVTTARQGPFFQHDNSFKTVNIYRLSYPMWSSKLARLIDWYIDEVSSGAYYENAIGMIAYASGDALRSITIDPGTWYEIDDPNDLRLARAQSSPSALAVELDRSRGGWWDFDVVDFSYLRNMHFPPPALVAQLRQRLEEAIHNYGSSQVVLDEKMAWFLDTDPEHTLALGGLSSLYPILVDTLDRPEALVPAPTFGEYAARFPQATTYDARSGLAALAQRIERDHPQHVVIVNPNNPTGTLHDTAALADLASQHPTCTFWADESFLPFTGQPSMRLHEPTATNVVVLASLSKDLGVPGLRLGFAWSADTVLLDGLRRRLPIWAISSPAEMFLTLALKFKDDHAASFHRTAADRAHLEATLAEVPGVRVIPGVHGDFVLVDVHDMSADRAGGLVEAMLRRRVLVKDVTERIGHACPVLRIAVRTPADHRLLVGALHAAVGDLSTS
jgi:histidinol-phosphate/aromatic aminotransferase/cobyric acid decarboxylase-like protein/choline kinase